MGSYKGATIGRSPEHRFYQYTDRTGDCWTWTRATRSGYGVLQIDGRAVNMHRWSYEHFKGPIPDGLVVDHLCNNRICVNPDHLEVKTVKENVLRGTGPSAINSRKTHCVKGHSLDDAYTDGNMRRCRQCSNEDNKLRRIRTRAHNPKPEIIANRDGWDCALCHGTIDKFLKFPDPMSASVDHTISLNDNGPHTLNNMQLAHLGCNSRKH